MDGVAGFESVIVRLRCGWDYVICCLITNSLILILNSKRRRHVSSPLAIPLPRALVVTTLLPPTGCNDDHLHLTCPLPSSPLTLRLVHDCAYVLVGIDDCGSTLVFYIPDRTRLFLSIPTSCAMHCILLSKNLMTDHHFLKSTTTKFLVSSPLQPLIAHHRVSVRPYRHF